MLRRAGCLLTDRVIYELVSFAGGNKKTLIVKLSPNVQTLHPARAAEDAGATPF